MRTYQIPKGLPGRPRSLLPYVRRPFERFDTGSIALTLIGVVGVGSLIWWWSKRDKPEKTVVAGSGFDMLGV